MMRSLACVVTVEPESTRSSNLIVHESDRTGAGGQVDLTGSIRRRTVRASEVAVKDADRTGSVHAENLLTALTNPPAGSDTGTNGKIHSPVFIAA